jgi:predicted transcriptional regulator
MNLDRDPMTDAELRSMREWLGVTGEWLADRLRVEGRTMRRWEAGTTPVPDGVRAELAVLVAEADAAVREVVAGTSGAARPVVVVPRSDPPGGMPAGWHRRIAVRASREVPDLSIAYEDT